MSRFLVLAYLFSIGSMGGWVLELLFRRFISGNNPERKWINPGFLTGPYVPLYGSGLCILFLLASLEQFLPAEHLLLGRVLLFLVMAAAMTLIEYLAGIFLLRYAHLRLWDYSSLKGNVNGLICPLFSLIWAAMGAAYYFLLYPVTLRALEWLARNLAFSFFIGMFFGVFLVDLGHTMGLAGRLRKFALEHDVIVRYEVLKAAVRRGNEEAKARARFLFAFRSAKPLREILERSRAGENVLPDLSQVLEPIRRRIRKR